MFSSIGNIGNIGSPRERQSEHETRRPCTAARTEGGETPSLSYFLINNNVEQ